VAPVFSRAPTVTPRRAEPPSTARHVHAAYQTLQTENENAAWLSYSRNPTASPSPPTASSGVCESGVKPNTLVRFDPPDEAVLLDAHPLGRRRRAQHVIDRRWPALPRLQRG